MPMQTENEYELICQNLISFIIDDSQPFNIVECKSFRKLLHSLDLNFSIPCNKTVKTTVSKAFSWSKQQLTNIIANDSVTVSIIMDFWTSRCHHGYVGITSISTLVKTLKGLLQQSYIESVSTDISELTIFDSMEEIIDDTKDFVEIKEVDLTLGIVHKKIDISMPMVTIGMVEKVKKALYDSIYKYWQSVIDIGILACLLDLCFKKLRFANTNVIQKTNEQLKSLYESECEVYNFSNHSAYSSNIQTKDLEANRVQKK
ncbi:1463_t:CDS:2 [Dentiscutata erythropus]|uniref:1463_t:CDS:1 n=1 Tax=Dentiscutata erythropus TaxID=1348616 RepID=A0A9N9HWD1_9GLOM|nr:1463_t:CDS:2 [Dentiscutata erythropus]